MRSALSILLLAMLMSVSARGQGVSFETAEGAVRMDLSGIIDLEGYQVSSPPPGLIYGEGGAFFNPRRIGLRRLPARRARLWLRATARGPRL